MATRPPLVLPQVRQSWDAAATVVSDARYPLRIPAAEPAEQTRLHLSGEADIVAVQLIYDEARAAANRGDEVSIHCEDATCFDLGALQLLRALRDEVHTSQLKFVSHQRARVLDGWLALVAT